VTVLLHVVGVPASQGSKTRMPNGAMVDGTSNTGRAALSAWRKAVADAARAYLAEHPQPPLDEPLKVRIEFRFAPTKSDPYRTMHATKPDIDKTIRATFDALKHGGLIGDDARICELLALKRYAGEAESVGAVIEVFPLGAVETARREALKQVAKARRRLEVSG
jgi:Holliday junction resolvase RusA-like endonuclease